MNHDHEKSQKLKFVQRKCEEICTYTLTVPIDRSDYRSDLLGGFIVLFQKT